MVEYIDNAVSFVKSVWAWLPTVAGMIGGFFAGLYYVVQLYESRTFQHWKNNFLMKRRIRRLAKLKAREKILVARIAALEKIRHARAEAREMVADATAEAATLLTTESTKAAGLATADALKKS